MFIRMPVQGPFANSDARLALMIRSESGTRLIAFGSRTVVALILLAALFFAWFLVASFYLVMRDDFVAAYFTGQRRDIHAYESRILELRSRIDRITARQLLNQDTIEDRVSTLVARQAEIEARQIMVSELAAKAETTGVALPQTFTVASETPATTGSAPLSFAPIKGKPQPLPPTAPQRLGMMAPAITPPNAALPRGPMESVVAEVERRSVSLEQAQKAYIAQLGEAAEKEIARSKTAVAALGIDPSRFGKKIFEVASPAAAPSLDEFTLRDVSGQSAMGGPLLPLPARTDTFDMTIGRVETTLENAIKARAVFRTLPIGRPISDKHELTSNFGARLDPFTRSLAQHSGVDFRAPAGTNIKAVAPGKVIEAGYNGGYGRMVEIDHGHGITTRYAHMSSISVSEGQRVEKGTVIGHVGSTGRSTGPHLHYEVRIDDDATDPMRFVKAERLLATN